MSAPPRSALAADETATTISVLPGSYDGAELLKGVFWNTLRITGERGPADTVITRIANNVFFENQYDFSPELDLVAYLDLHHNLLGSGSFTGLSDNFSADPLFRDAGADDYHLLPASPAASAGDSSVVAGPDLEGAARRDPPTLGAYEVDSVSEARFPGLTCGDGIVQDAPRHCHVCRLRDLRRRK